MPRLLCIINPFREGLTTFDPTRPPLSVELSTAKFTILPGRDANGATLALFNAHRHDPSIVEHKTTLQGVVYQLDVAMEQVIVWNLLFFSQLAATSHESLLIPDRDPAWGSCIHLQHGGLQVFQL